MLEITNRGTQGFLRYFSSFSQKRYLQSINTWMSNRRVIFKASTFGWATEENFAFNIDLCINIDYWLLLTKASIAKRKLWDFIRTKTDYSLCCATFRIFKKNRWSIKSFLFLERYEVLSLSHLVGKQIEIFFDDPS